MMSPEKMVQEERAFVKERKGGEIPFFPFFFKANLL